MKLMLRIRLTRTRKVDRTEEPGLTRESAPCLRGRDTHLPLPGSAARRDKSTTMAAVVVYEGVPNTQGETGTLFQGRKVWFSATVPQRQWFVENVEANGGKVVPLEKQADILLVDHTRKNPAPGTHSYKYVEQSIRKGRLENLDDHVVGGTSRADRPVGSVTMAPKGGRNPYTEADDQFLWNWVKPLQEAGGAIAGNSIYQQLEAVNPKHTYQSWRDRWLKYVRHQKREITTRVHEVEHLQSTPRRQRVRRRAGGEDEDSPVRSRASVERHAPAQAEHLPKQKSEEVVIPPRNGNPDHDNALPALKSKGKAHSRRSAEHEKFERSIFADSDYDELFEAAPQILITQPDHIANAWQMLAKAKEREAKNEAKIAKQKGEMVQEKKTHLAEEWRAYFEMVVGPDYYERVEEHTGMQRDHYSAKGQTMSESATSEVRRAESNNHTASAESTTPTIGRRPSPSLQPESPVLFTSQPESPMLSFSTTQDRAPGPNEARKRSAGKGTNSQESISSAAHDAHMVEELSQRSTQFQKRKRNVETDDEDEDEGSPPLPPVGNQEQAKWMRSKQEPRSFEIPSTPELEVVGNNGGPDEEQDWAQEAGSPTPRPRHSHEKRVSRDDVPSSPLFVPQDRELSIRRWSHEPEEDRSSPPIDAGEDEQLPATPRQEKQPESDLRTSPLSVHLVSDHDPPPGSSFSQPRSDKEQDDVSPTPEFETAPEFSQVWETAHEEAEAARSETLRSQDGTVGETQTEDDFALPEPEGGWDDLPLPPEADGEERVATEDASQNAEDAVSETESMGGWVAAHVEADPDADAELLIKAAGMADLDFKLADVVYQHLIQGKPVPENTTGVWTEMDDRALLGIDAKEIRRIERKHGKEALEGRWHYLENEQR